MMEKKQSVEDNACGGNNAPACADCDAAVHEMYGKFRKIVVI